jgi:hypothetical protein
MSDMHTVLVRGTIPLHLHDIPTKNLPSYDDPVRVVVLGTMHFIGYGRVVSINKRDKTYSVSTYRMKKKLPERRDEMTITEHDTYRCIYCNMPETGEFNTETGNHVICEENAALRAEVERLRAVAVAARTLVDFCDDPPNESPGMTLFRISTRVRVLKNTLAPPDTQRATPETPELSEYAKRQIAGQK